MLQLPFLAWYVSFDVQTIAVKKSHLYLFTNIYLISLYIYPKQSVLCL